LRLCALAISGQRQHKRRRDDCGRKDGPFAWLVAACQYLLSALRSAVVDCNQALQQLCVRHTHGRQTSRATPLTLPCMTCNISPTTACICLSTSVHICSVEAAHLAGRERHFAHGRAGSNRPPAHSVVQQKAQRRACQRRQHDDRLRSIAGRARSQRRQQRVLRDLASSGSGYTLRMTAIASGRVHPVMTSTVTCMSRQWHAALPHFTRQVERTQHREARACTRLPPEAPPAPRQHGLDGQASSSRLRRAQHGVGIGALVRKCGGARRGARALQRGASPAPRQQAPPAQQSALVAQRLQRWLSEGA